MVERAALVLVVQAVAVVAAQEDEEVVVVHLAQSSLRQMKEVVANLAQKQQL